MFRIIKTLYIEEMTSEGKNGAMFEEEHFDFVEPVPKGFTSSNQMSGLSASLELVKSIALSRPFLMAVIAFLLYKLWNSGASGNSRKSSSGGPSIISVETVGSGKQSVRQDRLSRKSQHHAPPFVDNIPPVTMAGVKR